MANRNEICVLGSTTATNVVILPVVFNCTMLRNKHSCNKRL